MIGEITKYELTRARVGKNSLCLAAVPDGLEAYDRFTRLVFYTHDLRRWSSEALACRIQAIVLYQPEGETSSKYTALSAEGDVVLLTAMTKLERIAGAGIESPDSRFYGRMRGLRVIGDGLYACGDGGQFYRRRGPGDWVHLDPRFLQAPDTPFEEKLMLVQIDGPSEDQIYICGYRGKLIFYDGKAARRIDPGTDANLVDILVEDERTIWICGSKGALLRGNHREGFAPVPGVIGQSLFNSMALFDDKLHVAASTGRPSGLFVYDYGILRQVSTGLEPEIKNPHTLTERNGVMWAVSMKDIVRFDGARWERIDFPGNDPIR